MTGPGDTGENPAGTDLGLNDSSLTSWETWASSIISLGSAFCLREKALNTLFMKLLGTLKQHSYALEQCLAHSELAINGNLITTILFIIHPTP